jgi:hypothetical protein
MGCDAMDLEPMSIAIVARVRRTSHKLDDEHPAVTSDLVTARILERRRRGACLIELLPNGTS